MTQGEDKFGLSEGQRKEVWKKLLFIEQATRKEADGRYPLDPSISEQIGQSLILSKEILLVPSPNPSTAEESQEASITSAMPLPPGSQVLVIKTKKGGNKNWYFVEARTSGGDFFGKGWINGNTLSGQNDQFTFLEQLQRHRDIETNMKNDLQERLSQEHGLTLEQIGAIKIEALTKNWA